MEQCFWGRSRKCEKLTDRQTDNGSTGNREHSLESSDVMATQNIINFEFTLIISFISLITEMFNGWKIPFQQN